MGICWANSLKDCAGNVSGEHYASKCIFDVGKVVVQGFDWCKDDPKEIHINHLTANILCEKHNQELSPLDAEAGRVFANFQEAVRLFSVRSGLGAKRFWPNRPKFCVDGNLFERWLLKTLINFSVRGRNIIGLEENEPGKCPTTLAETAFGRRQFLGESGLYAAPELNAVVDPPLGKPFNLTTVLLGEKRLIGGMFSVSGIRLMIWLAQDRGPDSTLAGKEFDEWRRLAFTRRPTAFNFNLSPSSSSKSHSINFTWA